MPPLIHDFVDSVKCEKTRLMLLWPTLHRLINLRNIAISPFLNPTQFEKIILDRHKVICHDVFRHIKRQTVHRRFFRQPETSGFIKTWANSVVGTRALEKWNVFTDYIPRCFSKENLKIVPGARTVERCRGKMCAPGNYGFLSKMLPAGLRAFLFNMERTWCKCYHSCCCCCCYYYYYYYYYST